MMPGTDVRTQFLNRTASTKLRQRALRLTGAVRDRLVGVDRLVQLLAVEEVLQQLLDLRDARRPADEHDLVHCRLVELRVAQRLLDRVERAAEQVGAQLLEARARDRRVEVDALVERIDLDARLHAAREHALRALARRAQATHRALTVRYVLLALALELLRRQQTTAWWRWQKFNISNNWRY